MQKLSNKQSAKVICRFDILTTAHNKRLTSHYYEHLNLSAAHAFNYIVLRVHPGLTSCEDLATALMLHIQTISLDSVQLNHFVCMQNSTEVLCEVFIVVTHGFIYFCTM